jgi:hypothetical protein
MGNINRALEAVLQCWGGQIDIGATTFWEVYSPQWNVFIGKNDPVPNGQNSFTSLCHPWAGIFSLLFVIVYLLFAQLELLIGCQKTSLAFSQHTVENKNLLQSLPSYYIAKIFFLLQSLSVILFYRK